MLTNEKKVSESANSFRILGAALIDLSDKYDGSVIEIKCGAGINLDLEADNKPDCKKAIDGWSGTFHVTIHAQQVPANATGYRLLNGYVTTLASLFENGSSSLPNYGYSPMEKKQLYIINMDNKYKDVQTRWSKDFSSFTINAPADLEVDGWDGKTEKGFEKGWSKNS
ncbi:MAG: hypothetical protein JST63_16510 [Bacteroidetes bacterium]|nr:hypothetical protein [Bacteroidota bacterium]